MCDILDLEALLSKLILDGEKAISELITDGSEMVRNVEIANEKREWKRCEKDSLEKKERARFLEERAQTAALALEEANAAWPRIINVKDSIEIHNACSKQKEKCEALIGGKNETIRLLKEQLAEVDGRFLDDQEAHREDINVLVTRINKHAGLMIQSYRNHLRLVRNKMWEKFHLIFEEKRAVWEKDCDGSREIEKEFLAKQTEAWRKFRNDFSRVILRQRENYGDMKEKLDIEHQTLRENVEHTRWFHFINFEKLNYEYGVLRWKEEEMTAAAYREKNRVNRMGDILNGWEEKRKNLRMDRQTKLDKLKSALLENQSRSLDLKHKMQIITENGADVFQRVWLLSEKRATRFMEKIIQLDKIVREDYLQATCPSSFREIPKIENMPSCKLNAQFQIRNEEKLFQSCAKINSRLKFFILKSVAERRIKTAEDNSVLNHLSLRDKTLVLFDNILKELGIETDSELNILEKKFTPFVECATCNGLAAASHLLKLPSLDKPYCKSARTSRDPENVVKLRVRPLTAPLWKTKRKSEFNGVTAENCVNVSHELKIDGCRIDKILAEYADSKRERRIMAITENGSSPLHHILRETDVNIFWSEFRRLSAGQKSFWKISEEYFGKYLKLLEEYSSLAFETSSLERQNHELKQLLYGFQMNSAK